MRYIFKSVIFRILTFIQKALKVYIYIYKYVYMYID